MASSAHNRHPLLPSNMYYSSTAPATSAPPPTPSSQPTNITPSSSFSSSSTIDALTRLLHRLPPTLSLPTSRRGSSSLSGASPPLISFSDQSSISDRLLSASSQLGYFQLINHNISSHVAKSAELEALTLFKLSHDKKESYFPTINWPIGFHDNDEDGNGQSFWLDGDRSTSTDSSTELVLSSLRELTRGLEKVALEIVEMLSSAVGFESPSKEDPTHISSMILVHECVHGDKPDQISGGFYPYVVGLQYVIRSIKYSLLADSGWVAVVPEVDSVLVTIGDIAQVWSNGKLKKVRGRPLACINEDGKDSTCISMTLLLTLPPQATVSPLLPQLALVGNGDNDEALEEEGENNDNTNIEKEKRLFSSFSFEDYAWRVYYEPLIFKDPLDKYRISI